MKVRKRNGSLQGFEKAKIKKAIAAAIIQAKGSVVETELDAQTSGVEAKIFDLKDDVIDIDKIEKIIISSFEKDSDEKKAYLDYKNKRARIRRKESKPSLKPLADYIHYSKYAKRKEDGSLESFKETISRVEGMHIERFPEHTDAIRKAFSYVYKKKVLPSARALHFAGPRIGRHEIAGYNCSASYIDRPRFFSEAFYALLSGCGVGYSVQLHHVARLPALVRETGKVQHIEIEDTIIGWSEALDHLMASYFVHGDFVEFTYNKIRPQGATLKTAGGLSPGHRGLRDMIEDVRGMLDPRRGQKLRPIHCHDVICRVAECVLSGGIRRSSCIALFSYEDGEMLMCKHPENFRPSSEWDPGLNPQRALANNSAVFVRGETPKEDYDRLMDLANECYGEPGYFFTDSKEYATNPCAEASLCPLIHKTDKTLSSKDFKYEDSLTGFQFCNLCEINLAAIKTKEEFIDVCEAAAIIGTLQASYTDFKYMTKATQDITEREALLGVGLTGMCDSSDLAFNPEVLEAGAKKIVEVNKEFAKTIGINPSARCTVIKPSGTLSLELGGVASGIHPHHWPKYIRGVTANPQEPAAKLMMEKNPHAVKIKPNGDYFIEFPCETNGITLKDQTGVEFVKNVDLVFKHWIKPGLGYETYNPGASHNVSATCTIHPGEEEEVKAIVWEKIQEGSINAMAFAPWTLDMNFSYMPRKAVKTPEDEAHFDYLVSNWVDIDYSEMKIEESEVSSKTQVVACAGGACELT